MTDEWGKRQRRGTAFCLFVLGALVGPGLARAQTSAQPSSADGGAATSLDAKSRELADRRAALRGVEESLDAAETQRRKLESDIEAIRTDRARLSAALIETTGKIRASESRADAAQKRLDGLTGQEQAIRVSLGNRRAIVGEVLASLQRMGRRPPPALLVRPEDMLSAIRTSMLLGAVLPELRAETEALAADLAELVKLRMAIRGERDTLSRELAEMGGERQRLSTLVDARQQALSAAEQDLKAEHERTRDLSRKATSLQDLIASVEGDLSNQRAAEKAARAEAARKQADAAKDEGKTRLAGLPGSPFNDVARLAPAIGFAD